jgi:hypothetical protein
LFAVRADYSAAPCCVSTPVLPNGEVAWQNSGIAAENAQEHLDVVLDVELTDSGRWCEFILNHSPPSLTVSESFYQSWASLFDLAFVPFPIRICRRLRTPKFYRFLVPIRRYQIVDFDNAEIAYFDGIREPKFARRVLSWAVDGSRVPELQVFSDRMGLTIVTERFASELNSVTGVKTIRLDQLHEPLLGT